MKEGKDKVRLEEGVDEWVEMDKEVLIYRWECGTMGVDEWLHAEYSIWTTP